MESLSIPSLKLPTILPRPSLKRLVATTITRISSGKASRREGEVEFFLFKRKLQLPLTLLELRVALHRSGNTAAGPDGLHYIMLRHLSESYLSSLIVQSHLGNASFSHTVVSCPRFSFRSLVKIQHQQIIAALLPLQAA
ncbi:hypothetical protein TNCT_357371 [Trichonephila clavata]|uniref:Uncharacterized protein n=1 Tax=Trichonephila clavata TaxID=2740835 RepID=A0A8X6HMH1_TRICU|nr:hypothetical protein TNCT_357371 [Trichonephila clavata]